MTGRPKHDLLVGSVLSRTLAAFLSATIFLLTVLVVSPEAHEELHSDATEAHHTCAITLYAQGVTTPVCQVQIPLPLEHPAEVARIAAAELRLPTPRYWLKPLRGPPS